MELVAAGYNDYWFSVYSEEGDYLSRSPDLPSVGATWERFGILFKLQLPDWLEMGLFFTDRYSIPGSAYQVSFHSAPHMAWISSPAGQLIEFDQKVHSFTRISPDKKDKE